MRISRAALWTLVLVFPIVALAIVTDRRETAVKRLAGARSAVALRVVAMQPTSEWPSEDVHRFLQDFPDGATYDWIVVSARQSSASYREWYERGNHRMSLGPDRRLEPEFAQKLLRQVADCLRKGDLDSANYHLRQVRGEMNIIPFHPQPPSH